MVNYQEGKIYKIYNDDIPNKVYYGSTCNTLVKRLYIHKAIFNTCSSSVLFPGAKIVLVEKFPCNDKMELHKRERYYIENNECVNKAIPGRYDKGRQQYQKDYYNDNKEKLKVSAKTNREVNKNKLNESFECECGGKYIYTHKSTHIKTSKHQKYLKSQNK